jgi:hypothetical protein
MCPCCCTHMLAAGDFFNYKDAGGLFDIGYDYTFLCALHPDMRTAWAAGWGRHLSPGATLVTLIYPVDPSREGTPGPPWPVTPELYQQLLLPAGGLLRRTVSACHVSDVCIPPC